MTELQALTSPDALVQVAAGEGVRVLTLNRPAALNSFNAALHEALLQALENAAADPALRALVVTGAGRGFCAGQDLNDPALAPGDAGPADVGALVERHYRPLAARLRTLPMPVVCAVNGVAAGAGANFAFGCDIVLAARSASFSQAFSRIGLVPDCGGTWLLPRLVGRAHALALALTGDKLGADEAQRLGLIWQVVEDAALPAQAFALAQRLAAQPTRALVATRQAFDAAQSLTFDQALALEARVQRELGGAADFAEGVAAFREKRAPRFRER